LAEVTRRLGVNKSTCYSMLQALTEVGWLLRDPFTKTYRLGPALVAIGRAAASGFPALDFVRPAMVELSRSEGSHCVALAVAPDHVTVVDQVRDVRAVGAPIGHGYIPLRPPFGAAVAAWSRPPAAERWLGLAPDGTAERYAAALEVVRRRGYVVELAEPSWTPPTQGVSLPDVVEQLARLLPPEILPLELEPSRAYAVSAKRRGGRPGGRRRAHRVADGIPRDADGGRGRGGRGQAAGGQRHRHGGAGRPGRVSRS
jgi:DNA-binding IclR family transcriptional regulator